MVLQIKGHDIKFGFGLYFLGKAQKEYHTDLNGILQSLIKNPISDMVDLMFFSAKCEAELDDINLPISKRDFLNYLEENNDFDNLNGALSKWSQNFVETIKGNFLPQQEEEKEVEEETEKKN